jgi:hypothetical protein
MTIATTARKSEPLLTGSSVKQFPFTFPITAEEELLVECKCTATGEITTLTPTTDYSVTFTPGTPGGHIDTVAMWPSGYSFILYRDTPQTQETDLDNEGGWFPETLEAALDKLTDMVQEVNEMVTRSFKLALHTSVDVDMTLPTPSAGKALVWNEDEDGLENSAVTASMPGTAQITVSTSPPSGTPADNDIWARYVP